MTRARSVLLAALIVVSTVAVGVGPGLATAQSSSESFTYTGSPDTVTVDLNNATGPVEVEFSTNDTDSGRVALARKTYDAGDVPLVWFSNGGAYDHVTATVNTTEATFSTVSSSDDDYLFLTDAVKAGSTGGDATFTCDLSERMQMAVNPGVRIQDCSGLPGDSTINTTGTDAQQTKLDLYQSVQNTQASSENYHTTLDNYLQDTKTVARIKGKNAYIRSLNNGSSKTAAKYAAKQAVADYYATKQVQLINQWDIQMHQVQYMRSVAANESGLSASDVVKPNLSSGDGVSASVNGQEYGVEQSVTLVNSSSATAQTFRVQAHTVNSATGTDYGTAWTPYIGPSTTGSPLGFGSRGNALVRVEQPDPTSADDIYDAQTLLPWWEFGQRWSDIQTQTDTVQAEMDTLANNTYSAYQAGEINNSDLIDPYVLSQERSPGSEFQGWANAQLTLLGTNSPANYDQIGGFEVTTESGSSYTGVLHAAENPPSGQFQTNTTYDPSQIAGSVYLVTPNRMMELQSNFTIQNITTQSGQTIQNTTIEKTTYQTANVTELKQMYEDLANRRAQIEAREQALQNAGGSGGFLGGGKVSPIVALAIIGTLLGVVVLQN